MAQATPKQLPNLLKNYAGISGCARLAAKQKKAKKETYRDDWAPAPRPRAQLANWEPLAALPAQKGLTLHSPDCHVGESHPKKTFSTLSANG
jgi:hypothetical protein